MWIICCIAIGISFYFWSKITDLKKSSPFFFILLSLINFFLPLSPQVELKSIVKYTSEFFLQAWSSQILSQSQPVNHWSQASLILPGLKNSTLTISDLLLGLRFLHCQLTCDACPRREPHIVPGVALCLAASSLGLCFCLYSPSFILICCFPWHPNLLT